MSAALLVTVVVGTAVSVWQAQVAREQEHRATIEAARQKAVRDLYREAHSQLGVMAIDRPETLVKPGAVTTALVDKLREIAPRYADRPQERAAQLEAVMLQLNYDNRFKESLQVGKEYLAQLIANHSEPVPIIFAYGTLGSTLFQLQQWEESEAMRRAGMNWAPEEHSIETEKARVDIANDLGGILAVRGKRQDALTVLSRAEMILSGICDPGPLRNALSIRFGLVYLGFDDAKALQYMRQARAELLADGRADTDQQAYNGTLLGGALLATGATAEAESVFKKSLELRRQEFGRGSNIGVSMFESFAGAVARHEPERALALIKEERSTLAAEPSGISRVADISLLAVALDARWITGDTTSATTMAVPDVQQLWLSPGVRRSRLFLVALSRALVQAGRASEALRAIQPLAEKWPERGMPTALWLGIHQALAEAQFGAGQLAAAGAGATDLMQLLDAQRATEGSAYRCAATIAALTAARDGDHALATRLLERLEHGPMPAFPSGAERADCELRRAQALFELGRQAEAR